MKTIEIYEKTETNELQSLLKKFEIFLEDIDILFDRYDQSQLIDMDININEMKNERNDLEIDISLIRMELNRRLWEEQ